MQIFSEEQKHRLKIAARLLRKEGARFENGNFYEAVADAISKLDGAKRERLKDMINWLMDYESTESICWNTAPLPRMRKTQTKLNRKANSSGSRR